MSGLVTLRDVEGVSRLDPIRFCSVLVIIAALVLEIYSILFMNMKFSITEFCLGMGSLLFGGGAGMAVRRDIPIPSIMQRRDDV